LYAAGRCGMTFCSKSASFLVESMAVRADAVIVTQAIYQSLIQEDSVPSLFIPGNFPGNRIAGRQSCKAEAL
jgi:hypothetical protein